jgi:alanine dehydrogenase
MESKLMRVGIPREIKSDEYRVAMMPVGAESLVKAGHQVMIEAGAGIGSGFPDEDYQAVGARIVADVGEIFAQSDMIVKVKEPQPAEVARFRPGQIVFTYFHSRRTRR